MRPIEETKQSDLIASIHYNPFFVFGVIDFAVVSIGIQLLRFKVTFQMHNFYIGSLDVNL